MLRTVLTAAMALSLHAATPLYQASIDKPQNYAVVSGAARVDTDVLHNGNKSLRLEGAKGSTPTVVPKFPLASGMGAGLTFTSRSIGRTFGGNES